MVKWPKPGRKPNNQTNRPVEEHRYPEIRIYLAQGKVEAIPQIPPPPTDSPKTKSKSGDPTPPWKKHIEIAGFCVLVVYAAATVLMYFANKNSSEAARDAANAAQTSASIAASTMQIDQRPWI